MKIALVNPLRFQEGLLKKNEPLSLNYLKSYLVNRGYFVEIFDYELINDQEVVKTLQYIADEFDVVGISCYYPYLPNQLACNIKHLNSNIIIVAGGPMTSLSYQELLSKDSLIDYVVVNEGEITFYTLLEHLKSGKNPHRVLGVASFNNGAINYSPRSFSTCLDNIDFPIREQGYFNSYIPSIISSRGCNGRCRFCSTRYMGKWRGRTPKHVLAEVLHIVEEHNELHFQFVEPNFLENIDRSVEIAELLSTISQKISFDFACRIDSILNNKEKLNKLKKAGAIKVLLGIENFNDKTLKSWLKDITLQQIREAIEILNSIELCYSISLILFHPNVTVRELINNITIINELGISNKIENIFNYLRLIPGTAMNPFSTVEVWSFEDKKAEKIFKNCLQYEKSQQEKISKLSFDINYLKNNVEDFAETVYYLGNIRRMKFTFLKQQLGIQTIDENCLEQKKANYRLIINPYTKIKEIKGDTTIHSLNTDTGLIYTLNNTAISLVKMLHGKTLNDVISYLDETSNNEEKEFINDFIKGMVSLIANQILILGEDQNDRGIKFK